MLEAAHQLCHPAFDTRRIRVSRELPANLPVRADPDHQAQVSSTCCKTRLATRPRAAVAIAARMEAGSVLVTIANTGEDIPPEDLRYLFERFYRVDKSRDRGRGGAGIGLAIVRQLVEAARIPGTW